MSPKHLDHGRPHCVRPSFPSIFSLQGQAAELTSSQFTPVLCGFRSSETQDWGSTCVGPLWVGRAHASARGKVFSAVSPVPRYRQSPARSPLLCPAPRAPLACGTRAVPVSFAVTYGKGKGCPAEHCGELGMKKALTASPFTFLLLVFPFPRIQTFLQEPGHKLGMCDDPSQHSEPLLCSGV